MQEDAVLDNNELLVVSPSPHLRTDTTVKSIMYDVIIALIPAVIGALYYFGFKAGLLIAVCIFSAVLTEYLYQKIFGFPITIGDGSSALTGLLLAFCLPVGLPLWCGIVGSFVSIILGKMVFGGLGHNIFNPALIGRAFLLASWPVYMTSWWYPFWWKVNKAFSFFTVYPGKLADEITCATPLAIIKEAAKNSDKIIEKSKILFENNIQIQDLFFGKIGGCMGETSVILLLIGAAYLFYKEHITWHIPVSYIATVGILTGIFDSSPIIHIFSGGLILGAFFMATDMVTSPVSYKGQFVFGMGCGILTVLIRLYGGYPEGVCYSILIMNSIAPLIDKYIQPVKFGEVSSNE